MSSSEPIMASSGQRSLRGPAVWSVVLILGLGGWIGALIVGDPHRAWRALLINFLYFTPLASGMVTWSAVIMAARGAAMEPMKRSGLIGVAFAPVSLLMFAALWFGRSYWAGWMHYEGLSQGLWLDDTFVFARDGIALAILWALAAVFVLRLRRSRPKLLAGWLAFTYCAVFSLVAFDLVMALDPLWFSTLFGGYFFISGMYIAISAWTISAIVQRPPADEEHRRDFGKLIVAFSLLTTYMMFSQLIPIWYGNLPHEVRFVVPRLRLSPWRWFSLFLVLTVYLGPLVLLLGRRSKGSKPYLTAIAMLVLVGMWMERWWLVTPTLSDRVTLGLTELSITAASLAALILCVGAFSRRMPPEFPEEGRGS